MSDNPIEKYLTDIAEVHGTRSNVPETSFYPALENLLTGLGKPLLPRVRCVINLANRGAGLPDGGLFTAINFPATRVTMTATILSSPRIHRAVSLRPNHLKRMSAMSPKPNRLNGTGSTMAWCW
jgi:hypothetical protein